MLNNDCVRLAAVVALVGLAGCASNKAYRGCELDHPYHGIAEYGEVNVPSDLDAPPASRSYAIPSADQVSPQPENYLTAADAQAEQPRKATVSDCLLHPPAYSPPVDVSNDDLSDVKAPVKRRKLEREEEDDISGSRGGSTMPGPYPGR